METQGAVGGLPERIDPGLLAGQLLAAYGRDTEKLLGGVMRTPDIRVVEAFKTLNLLRDMADISIQDITAKKREIIEQATRIGSDVRLPRKPAPSFPRYRPYI